MRVNIKSWSSKFNKNKLFNIQKNTFFGFKKNSDFIQPKTGKVEEYEIEEKLPFIKGKYLVSQSKTKEIRNYKAFQLFALTPINIFFGYKTLKNIILIRPIRSIFCGILFLMISKVNYGIHKNLYQFIDKIYILEDGMRTEFTFFNKRENLITENIKIRNVNQKEVMFILQMAPRIFDRFLPIIIDNKVYFIAKENDILNKPIFSAVMSGKYIKEKINDKDGKTIDIL